MNFSISIDEYMGIFNLEVDWYLWGEETFEEARRRDVAILLSSMFKLLL